MDVTPNLRPIPTLRSLQALLRFKLLTSPEWEANPLPHKVFTHAITHIGKALGRLFGLSDDLDHDPASVILVAERPSEYARFLADVVICAIQAAEAFPGGPIELEAEVLKRAAAKGMISSEMDWTR